MEIDMLDVERMVVSFGDEKNKKSFYLKTHEERCRFASELKKRKLEYKYRGGIYVMSFDEAVKSLDAIIEALRNGDRDVSKATNHTKEP